MSDIVPKHWFEKPLRSAQVQNATESEINQCVSRLQELVELGEEIVALLEPATNNERATLLRSWLSEDIESQRALLAKFRANGYEGADPERTHWE